MAAEQALGEALPAARAGGFDAGKGSSEISAHGARRALAGRALFGRQGRVIVHGAEQLDRAEGGGVQALADGREELAIQGEIVAEAGHLRDDERILLAPELGLVVELAGAKAV